MQMAQVQFCAAAVGGVQMAQVPFCAAAVGGGIRVSFLICAGQIRETGASGNCSPETHTSDGVCAMLC